MVLQEAASGEMLDYAQADGVMTVTINRPGKKNAVTRTMWLDLASRFEAVSADQSVRVVVIRGAGADFSAGADIGEFEAVRRDAVTARSYEAANSAAFAAIRNASVPVIAAIRGLCLGGGLGIAAACDLRLATPEAVFSVPAARLGLAYPQDAMADIVTGAGGQLAKYLTFTAQRIDAQAALRAGFLLEIVEPQVLDNRIEQIVQTIARNAPLSVKASKAAINAVLFADPAAAEQARTLGALSFESLDYAEGRAAFSERREPSFNGR